MKKIWFYVVLLVGDIAFMTGMAFNSVGQTSHGSTYDWTLPVIIFVTMTTPAILGFLIGKGVKGKNETSNR